MADTMKFEEVAEVQRLGAPSVPPASFTAIVLKQIDTNLFLGEESSLWHPDTGRGVYGGQIVGQALSAALKTVPSEKHVHSLHSYFLMKGDAKRNIVYQVQNLRDGKSFSARLVTASQQGSTIFVLVASFQIPHPANQPVINHQIHMPEVPPPEQLPTSEQYYEMLVNDPRCPVDWKPFLTRRMKGGSGPIDARPVITADFFARFGPPPSDRPRYPQISDTPRQAMWMKCKKKLPDDPTVHAAVLAYASDMNLLGTAKHDISILDIAVIASLDHAMWFHSEFRADEWLLYALDSPRATDGRGLAYGGIFTRDGKLVVTVAQEGVLRLKSKA